MLIQFVPQVGHVPDEKNGKSLTVKFRSSTVKKTYTVLVEGGTEAFINHIKVHKTSMDVSKVTEEAVAARALILANRRNIATLTVADPVVNQEEIDNLVEANCELDETVCTL